MITQQQAVSNVIEKKVPPPKQTNKKKKGVGTVVEFFPPCSEECLSSFLACEHFSQHHIWLLEEWREGGGE